MLNDTTPAPGSVPAFNNASGLDFKDISSEAWREYTVPIGGDGKTTVIRIERALKLHVSASGGHRVFSADGVSHYIPAGWVHLRWKVLEGAPHFVA